MIKAVPCPISRRMDDLGRVVIPKEMRVLLDIKEGDTLNVWLTKSGVYIDKAEEEI